VPNMLPTVVSQWIETSGIQIHSAYMNGSNQPRGLDAASAAFILKRVFPHTFRGMSEQRVARWLDEKAEAESERLRRNMLRDIGKRGN
jgi:hypothetical protein